MKKIVTLKIVLLLSTTTIKAQSPKLIRDYKLKPINKDTVYVYIEGRYKHKADKTLAEIWQQDLQTGLRWYSLCPRNEIKNIPKTGSVVKMLRKEMELISK